MSNAIEPILSESLSAFTRDLASRSWTGRRENEAVSLFALGFLLKHVRDDGPLFDPAQLGFDVSVPQIKNQRALTGRSSAGPNVFKDLVVWPKPRMTCWDDAGRPRAVPLAILEWKFDCHNTRLLAFDVAWLQEFTSEYPGCLGYAVCATRRQSQVIVRYTKVQRGVASEVTADDR